MDIQKIIEDVTKIEISMVNLSVDLDDIKKGLKNYIHDVYTKFILKRKAKKLAINDNFTASNYKEKILPFEQNIINKYIQRIYSNQKLKEYTRALTNAENNILEYTISLENYEKSLAVTNNKLTANELTACIKNSKASFEEKHNTMIRKLNALRRFKEMHKQQREVTYPESKVLFWGLLFFVLILESMANAYFYAQSSDLGLLGGVLQAFLVSIANIVISFGIGFILFRYTNHISKVKKTIAWLGIILSFFVISFLHLITAHYREILLKYPDNNIKNVIHETWMNPFNLSDFDSFILIIIGYFITILVIFKSYNYDDKYPHLGKIQREYEQAKEEIQKIQSASEKKFENARVALLKDIESISQIDFAEQQKIIQRNLATLETTRKKLKSFIAEIETNSLNYLNLFRDYYNHISTTGDQFEINENLNNHIKVAINSLPVPEYIKEAKNNQGINEKTEKAEKLLDNIKTNIHKIVDSFRNIIEGKEDEYKNISQINYLNDDAINNHLDLLGIDNHIIKK